MIEFFRGDYAFLSNFYPSLIVVKGLEYPTAEHAFQACKGATREAQRWVRGASTPGEAKRRGRQVEIRPDWEQVKRKVMLATEIAKFEHHPDLLERLAGTFAWPGPLLVEGNDWHDNYWGSCVCGKCNEGGDVYWAEHGQNYLGQILMATRMLLC